MQRRYHPDIAGEQVRHQPQPVRGIKLEAVRSAVMSSVWAVTTRRGRRIARPLLRRLRAARPIGARAAAEVQSRLQSRELSARINVAYDVLTNRELRLKYDGAARRAGHPPSSFEREEGLAGPLNERAVPVGVRRSPHWAVSCSVPMLAVSQAPSNQLSAFTLLARQQRAQAAQSAHICASARASTCFIPGD
jgi:hypothetical protein